MKDLSSRIATVKRVWEGIIPITLELKKYVITEVLTFL